VRRLAQRLSTSSAGGCGRSGSRRVLFRGGKDVAAASKRLRRAAAPFARL